MMSSKQSYHWRINSVRQTSRNVPASIISVLLTGYLCAWIPGGSRCDEPSVAPPSSFAPAADLEKQVAYFVERIEKQLVDESDFGEDQQANVERDANTLAVVAVVLANHDEPVALKAPLSALLSTAQALAAAAGDFSAASAALADVQRVLAADETSEPVEWQSSGADLAVLMKQVPIVNNSLRRGVTGRRFKRSAERSAGLAATLAALAHVSAFDDAYCAGVVDKKFWRQWCDEMRDSAGRVNQAVHDLDQKAAEKALDQIVESCDRCHEQFRD